MAIGERLKMLRINHNFTLEEVGKKIGTTKQTLHKYENDIVNNITSDKIERLANLYNTTPSYIMGWEKSPNSTDQELSVRLMQGGFMNIGEKIKERRLKLDIPVDEIVKKLDINRTTYYRYESAYIKKLPVTILKPLAEILNTTPGYLMGWQKSPNSTDEELSVRLMREGFMNLGKRIKQRRLELSLTQEDLAKILGYKSKSTINKIELGINDISQSKILPFAKALKTTPAYLMGWEDNHNCIKHEFPKEIKELGVEWVMVAKKCKDYGITPEQVQKLIEKPTEAGQQLNSGRDKVWYEKLKAMKKESRMTTQEISEKCSVPIGTLNKIFAHQTKNPKLETIKRIVHCLGYSLDDLIDIETINPSNDEIELLELYRTLNDSDKKRSKAFLSTFYAISEIDT